MLGSGLATCDVDIDNELDDDDGDNDVVDNDGDETMSRLVPDVDCCIEGADVVETGCDS